MFSSVHQCTLSIFGVIQLISNLIIFCNCHESAIDCLSRGAGGFKDLLLSGRYVDKSLLISEILKHDEKVFQITRPLKWGKTLILEMMKTFFEIEVDEKGDEISDKEKKNSLLFKGGEIKTVEGNKLLTAMKISDKEDAVSHLGKYPVISLSLKDVKGNSISEIERSIQRLAVDLFGKYPFIKKYMENSSCFLDDEEKERLRNFVTGNLEGEYIFDFLEFLSMILYEHYNSYICLLIDDYDLPLINAYLKFGVRGKEFEYVVDIFRRIYDYTFKDNQYLFKAVISGTLNLEIVPSGKSEFKYKYILYNSVWDEEFWKYYGILPEELEDEKTSLDFINTIETQRWFGGYLRNEIQICNMGSVVHSTVAKSNLEYYLLNSVNSDIFNFICDTIMSEESLHEDLHLLSEGKEIIRNQFSKSIHLRSLGNDLFSMLAHFGILVVKPPQRVTEQPVWRMKIPNLESRGVLAAVFKVIAANELKISLSEYSDFTNLLLDKQISDFEKKFEKILLNLDMFNTTKRDEHIYHNLMNNIAASLGVGYLVDSIKEFGLYRGEHLIIPFAGFGKCAINIEYTVCTPWQPMEQFVRASLENMLHRPKHCISKIHSCSHVSEILYLSIGFCGQKVMAKYKTVKIK